MMREIKISIVTALAAFVMLSCAREKEESANDIQKRILSAYIAEYYPSATVMPSGLTYLNRTEGAGDAVERYNGAYVEYTTKTLDGNYTSTNDVELVKFLGTYSKTTYYGPKLYEIGYGNVYLGVEEMMLGMKKGGEATAIIPPWLTKTQYSSSSQASSVNTIYTFKLKHVVKDIVKFQIDSMASYAKIHYPGLDTTSYGFYFKNLVKSDKDTVANNSSANVRYVGRLLDGFIFDTNIADTAKKYGIYQSSNDYKALNIKFEEELSTMVESSGMIRGFCKALKEMKHYEAKAFTMFYSDLGYTNAGKGQIGPFQPLIFWIYIEPKED